MILITIRVKEVRVFLIFSGFFFSCFELTFMGDLFGSMNFLSLVHDGYMWMVHKIFHAMFESNKCVFCWFSHIATEAHCEILKIIASLDSDLNDSTSTII